MPNTNNQRNSIYGDDRFNYENAVKHYKISVSINPNYSKAFYSLGTLMLSKSKLNKEL